MVTSTKSEFHIVTSLGLHKNFDKSHIINAFKKHLDNDQVTMIHILTESENILSSIPFLDNKRIQLAFYETRPTFKELFDYSNLISSENIIVSLMNSDISFIGESDIRNCFSLLNNKEKPTILTLSRYDKNKEGESYSLQLKDRVGLPNYLSCDSWIFKTPIHLRKDISYFAMGKMNCDMMLGYILTESGYTLLNPCFDIKTIHHENTFKNISYYDDLNASEEAEKILGLHWAKNCNIPFHVYGAVWNHIDWINRGYTPLPVKHYNTDKIYLLLDDFREYEKKVIILTEIICKINNLDLMVLINANNIDSDFIGEVGINTTHVYFIEIDDIETTLKQFMLGEQGYHDSVAFIRDFSKLSPELITEFDAIFLDQRHITKTTSIKMAKFNTNILMVAKERYEIALDSFVSDEEIDLDTCTLITSMYETDDFLQGFYNNITALSGYSSYSHEIFYSKLSELELSILFYWYHNHTNLILGWYKSDPGLYECWNIGLRIATSLFVSNANVDDLRHPNHTVELLKDLRDNNVAVAASAVIPFEQYTDNISEIHFSDPWYTDLAGEFGLNQLAVLEENNGNWSLKPNNLPHCMPIWRKSLHDNFGYFDENRYGTFADWAFWLKITKNNEKGYLNIKPLTYYFINVTSHNRRGKHLDALHKIIERDFLTDFYYQKYSCIEVPKPNEIKGNITKKLNITGLHQTFGEHRNSFNRLIESLSPLHKGEDGINFIPFIERYFVWGDDEGEANSVNPYPIEKPWIGILHVPFDAPKWFEIKATPEVIFKTELWQQSIPYCRGLICLTEDIKKDLAYVYPNLPSMSVKHPTELSTVKFNWNAYVKNPSIVQAGDWLRRLQAIYEVETEHNKVMLTKTHTNEYLRREIEVFGDLRNDTVDVRKMVSNEEYDKLLSSSVVFVWLYATAANNLVIECISRCTPIIINPLPSVVEYLGNDYPLYMNDLAEATSLLADKDKIFSAYQYLKNHNELRAELDYKNFYQSIASSNFYAEL